MRNTSSPALAPDAFGRERPAIEARAGPAGEQAGHMAGIIVQPLAAFEAAARCAGRNASSASKRVGEWPRLAEYRGVDIEQQLGILISRSPEHHAIDMSRGEPSRFVDARDPAVKQDRPIGDGRA